MTESELEIVIKPIPLKLYSAKRYVPEAWPGSHRSEWVLGCSNQNDWKVVFYNHPNEDYGAGWSTWISHWMVFPDLVKDVGCVFEHISQVRKSKAKF